MPNGSDTNTPNEPTELDPKLYLSFFLTTRIEQRKETRESLANIEVGYRQKKTLKGVYIIVQNW